MMQAKMLIWTRSLEGEIECLRNQQNGRISFRRILVVLGNLSNNDCNNDW